MSFWKVDEVFEVDEFLRQGVNFCRSTQKPFSLNGNQCVDQFVSINFTVVDHVSRSVPKFVDQFLDHLVTWWIVDIYHKKKQRNVLIFRRSEKS